MGGNAFGVTMREKYVAMLNRKFAPYLDPLESQREEELAGFQKEIEDEIGYTDIQNRLNELDREKEELQRQMQEINPKVPRPGANNSWDTIRLSEKKAREQFEERTVVGKKIKAVRAVKTQIADAIWLAGAPGDVASMFENLDDTIAQALKE